MSGPGTPLRVLLVEDSDNDAPLLLRQLRRGGYEPVHERVRTTEEMERALEEASKRGKPWQLVISDCYVSRFRAPDALDLLRRLGYDTPFIVVSGKIGEDAAVAMMRAGAQDYVAKENLARLCPAIERELREAVVRRERKRAGEALRFLTEASAELSSSLDYHATLAGVARLAVPHLADWCAVDVLEKDGSTHRLAVEHEDPAKVALALKLQERYPSSPDARSGIPNVLRTGRSEFYPEVSGEMLEAVARDEDHLRILREIGFTSVVIVPMTARGRTLGAITFVTAESGRRYEEADLELAEELARRAALAVDNARLYDEAHKEIAERERAQEQLRDSRAQLEIILRGVADGITAQDPSGHLIYANEAAARITGYPTARALLKAPLQEVTGKFEVADESGRPLPLDELPGRRALRGEKAEALLRFREVATDEERWSVVSATPVFDERRRVRFAVNIFRDITERRRTEEALREVREAERNRIARDLHDDILQDIVYALQEIQIMQVTSKDGAAPALEEAAQALRRSVEGLRGAIFELRLRETLGRSFVSSLEALLDLNRRRTRKRYELELIVEDGFPRTLSEKAGRELVRIVQEALTNVSRHAEARHVRVRLERDGDLARVEVADDGRGFDTENPGIGVGQQSMRHRALEIGGELEVRSAPGRGTRVRIEAPLSRLIGG